MPDRVRELTAAIAAVSAGLQVARERIGSVRVQVKTGVDVVTEADVAAEDAIRGVLGRDCPDIDIVGEERGGQAATASYWLIDPICGTRNYASELPLYCANLALVTDGVVQVAVVGDGVNGQVYAAERGHPAFVASDPGRPLLRARDVPIIALDLGGKPPYADSLEAVGTLYARLVSDGRHHIRMLGTTLPLAKVATGAFGAALMAPSSQPVDPLHCAAGCALAEAAGAIVSDEHGDPWTLESAGFVAAATPELHARLVALMRECFRSSGGALRPG
jgi:myo-inositol-1(or 4)-monophosphatase